MGQVLQTASHSQFVHTLWAHDFVYHSDERYVRKAVRRGSSRSRAAADAVVKYEMAALSACL
jgi:hypothetical protein